MNILNYSANSNAHNVTDWTSADYIKDGANFQYQFFKENADELTMMGHEVQIADFVRQSTIIRTVFRDLMTIIDSCDTKSSDAVVHKLFSIYGIDELMKSAKDHTDIRYQFYKWRLIEQMARPLSYNSFPTEVNQLLESGNHMLSVLHEVKNVILLQYAPNDQNNDKFYGHFSALLLDDKNVRERLEDSLSDIPYVDHSNMTTVNMRIHQFLQNELLNLAPEDSAFYTGVIVYRHYDSQIFGRHKEIVDELGSIPQVKASSNDFCEILNVIRANA
jgi:hypothetical protein